MNEQALENTTQKALATRWSRLWAALIDAVLAMAITVPLMIYFNVWELAAQGEVPIEVLIKPAVISWGLFFVMHGYLLKNYGQTIGKKILGISIVTLDGSKPDFWPLIIKRYLPLALVSYVPLVGRHMPIIDALFIFRRDKRCLHDLIAGTMVVNFSTNKSSQQDTSKADASA